MSCNGGSAPSFDTSAPDVPPAVEVNSPDTSKQGVAYLEIADLPGAVLDCTKTTPGPDIDAAVLYPDPSKSEIKGMLESCTWLEEGTACADNTMDDPSDAEGEETDSPVAGFVSLNGGRIICRWSGSATLRLGNLVRVYEVGAHDKIEPFQIRACSDEQGAKCGKYATINENKQTVPAGKIL